MTVPQPQQHSPLADAGSSARKRPRDLRDCTHRRTRMKLSPPVDNGTASKPSISEESALTPTSVPDELTDASDVGSESSSDVSESSDEPSSESESESESEEEAGGDLTEESEVEEQDGEEQITNLRSNRGKKPKMKLSKDDLGPDLRPFLDSFLPKLKAANDELEAQREAGILKGREIERGDEEDGGEGYIEMNLGLGVLEEKSSFENGSSSGSDSDEDGGNDDVEAKPKERDILGKLMGRGSKKNGAGIQEIAEAKAT